METTRITHPLLAELFSAFTPEECDRFTALLRSREISEGDPLFQEGEAADEMFFILSGAVAVHKKSGFGGKTKVVALLAEGSLAGEACIAGKGLHGASVVAVKDCSTLILLRSGLELLEKENPGLVLLLLKKILKISSLRLQKSSERLALVL